MIPKARISSTDRAPRSLPARASSPIGLTPSDYDRMAVLRERGMTYAAIAEIFGCSASTVEWHCLRLGASPPHPWPLRPDAYLKHPVIVQKNRTVRMFSPQEDEKLLALEAQGVKPGTIGRVLGRRRNSVVARLMTLARHDERAGR